MTFQQKITQLKEIILSHRNFAVAFSGGVDSTFLLLFAKLVISEHNKNIEEKKSTPISSVSGGFSFVPEYSEKKEEITEEFIPHRLVAVHADAPNFSKDDLAFAENLCNKNEIEYIRVALDTDDMLSILSSGGKRRCYYCKYYFYSELLKELGIIHEDADTVSEKNTSTYTEGLPESEILEDYPDIGHDINRISKPRFSDLNDTDHSIGFSTGSSDEQLLEFDIPVTKYETEVDANPAEDITVNEGSAEHPAPPAEVTTSKFLFIPLVSPADEDPGEGLSLTSSEDVDDVPFVLADGTNASDDPAERPGMKAAEELGIISPLRECGITKAEIRKALTTLKISNADKPSSTCYATRVPYGENVDKETLEMISKSENFLLDIGFSDVRVRKQGTTARIEVLPEQIHEFFDIQIMEKIDAAIKSFGFERVSLDLVGYIS